MYQASNKILDCDPSTTHLKDHQEEETCQKSAQDLSGSKFESIQPLTGNPEYHTYHCPHCKKVLLNGNVHRLNMVCFHCYRYIAETNPDLLS